MTKCDFCLKSGPRGKCFWGNDRIISQYDCEKAIKKMVEALGGKRKNG